MHIYNNVFFLLIIKNFSIKIFILWIKIIIYYILILGNEYYFRMHICISIIYDLIYG